MQPTPSPSHWHYSFKHKFSFPPGAIPEASAAATGAAEAAGAAAGAARFAAGGAIPPHLAQYHYYGNGYPYRRWGRGFGMRRLFWFGLGIGAATLWIRHKERCRERERYLATGVPGTMSEQERWKWQHGWYRSVPTQAQTSTHPQSQNHINEAHPIMPIAPLASTTAYPTTTTTTTPNPPEQDSTRRWGYSYRRARRLEAERERERERAAAASAATEVPLPTTTSGLAPTDSATSLPTSQAAGAGASGSIGADEEMRKLREAVEALWAEKKRGVVEAQEKANEQAKEFAREKLDRLSHALEALRDSLGQNQPKQPPQEKKLV
ncbi:hypothetical protein EHS25_005208 [Saitozyma podzolica]|uniref:Uncharacterized protein n=1 Tax=Saitozyma podzolica TaxID=1890683 RepID=A0A427XYJ1_9TREE|nr:hypothetical protein EHS25_005208 [Saitozyma podzolica]